MMSISRPQAEELIRFKDSYTTLPAIICLYEKMVTTEWLELLGDHWSRFDNISAYRETLEQLLPDGNLPQLMTAEELERLNQLPPLVTIYRGCGFRSINGLSWTIDRSVAEDFLFYNRYSRTDPVIVKAVIGKRQLAALKECRGESEIIAKHPRITEIKTFRKSSLTAAYKRFLKRQANGGR